MSYDYLLISHRSGNEWFVTDVDSLSHCHSKSLTLREGLNIHAIA